ncbi:MAG: hypothetical protein M3N07_03245 [Pseudomonadota bacterium]|nr:hypothetical protein [Pseudomonadota bacterium]
MLAHQERQGIEIARAQLHRHAVTAEPPLARVENKAIEAKAAGFHFSAKPQELLVPLSGRMSHGPSLTHVSGHGNGKERGTGGNAGHGRLEDNGLGATAFLLLLPLVAMQFTDEVNWDVFRPAARGAGVSSRSH